jgi:small subunit ribosomal protein S20
MPNKASAKKRLRQTVKKATENKNRKTRIKTFVKKVEQAIVKGDQAAANEVLSLAQSEIMKGVTKGVVHKNSASRKISRLNSRVKGLKKAS